MYGRQFTNDARHRHATVALIWRPEDADLRVVRVDHKNDRAFAVARDQPIAISLQQFVRLALPVQGEAFDRPGLIR